MPKGARSIARGTLAAADYGDASVSNPGPDSPVRLLDFVRMIEKAIGCDARIDRGPPSEADVTATWAADTETGE